MYSSAYTTCSTCGRPCTRSLSWTAAAWTGSRRVGAAQVVSHASGALIGGCRGVGQRSLQQERARLWLQQAEAARGR